MPSTPTRFARQLAVAGPLLAFASLTLTGCDSDPDRFAPPCPQPSIPRDLGDLHRFRGIGQAGGQTAGRDITDSILDGRITGLEGTCVRDTRAVTVATISVGLELTRGPASNTRAADVAYFVAVSDGDAILDKRVYTLHAEFPPNTEHLRLAGDEVELRLPTTEKKTAAAYRVSVGFQLTPAELAANRARPTR